MSVHHCADRHFSVQLEPGSAVHPRDLSAVQRAVGPRQPFLRHKGPAVSQALVTCWNRCSSLWLLLFLRAQQGRPQPVAGIPAREADPGAVNQEGGQCRLVFARSVECWSTCVFRFQVESKKKSMAVNVRRITKARQDMMDKRAKRTVGKAVPCTFRFVAANAPSWARCFILIACYCVLCSGSCGQDRAESEGRQAQGQGCPLARSCLGSVVAVCAGGGGAGQCCAHKFAHIYVTPVATLRAII